MVNIVVAWLASLALDGFRDSWHEYSVPGQQDMFAAENKEQMEKWVAFGPRSRGKAGLGVVDYVRLYSGFPRLVRHFGSLKGLVKKCLCF